ncbi:histone methylation protein DOT1-domain-containing protein [Lentinula aff. detonsa]|nr:histone methylation protein DOT1-domain-containing protein [Lentinula aff. detonsa]
MSAIISQNISKYISVFPDTIDQSGLPFPSVALVYPGSVASERFFLCRPIRHIDYEPVTDLMETITLFVSGKQTKNCAPLPAHTLTCSHCSTLSGQLKEALHHQSFRTFNNVMTDMNRLFAQTPRLSQQSLFSPILEGSYGRCGLWGVPFGKVELELGDMCKSPRVIQLMGVADLVLINNKVFNAILMEQIKCLFHHLKKGSIIVSTQSFTLCSTTRRGTQTRHALNDPSLQFKTETLEYKPEWVSWGSKSGLFYWQTKM